ncbi:Protein kinase-like domain [Pseudocohnilembus persalinus]|uniref:Protein kinase-like domain n=1 Tax=Pseudocohnilembus persalinus TaxID=266149 RepID=A0A0V0QD60_PSEPJ|nr:Protein kinase-like domain [Pseudocohnilembus persalinus]|eukprot:KRX00147.1 Protein kinase-like domain [Pseudocohnilembus persalinus]
MDQIMNTQSNISFNNQKSQNNQEFQVKNNNQQLGQELQNLLFKNKQKQNNNIIASNRKCQNFESTIQDDQQLNQQNTFSSTDNTSNNTSCENQNNEQENQKRKNKQNQRFIEHLEVNKKVRILNSAKVLFPESETSSSEYQNSQSDLQQQQLQLKQNQFQQQQNFSDVGLQLKKNTSSIIPNNNNNNNQLQQTIKKNNNINNNNNIYNKNITNNNINNNGLHDNKEKITQYFQKKNVLEKQQSKLQKSNIKLLNKNQQYLESQLISREESNNSANSLSSQDKIMMQNLINQYEKKLQEKNQILEQVQNENNQLKEINQQNSKKVMIFKEKVGKNLQKILVERQKLLRNDQSQKIQQKKMKLGDFITVREGTSFKKVWQDGSEIQQIVNRLIQINENKKNLEQKKEKLKTNNPNKKTGYFKASYQQQKNMEEQQTQYIYFTNSNSNNQLNNQMQLQRMNSIENNINNNNTSVEQFQNQQAFKNQSILNLSIFDNQQEIQDIGENFLSQKELDEAKKKIKLMISMLKKEEEVLNCQLYQLNQEKFKFIRELNLFNDELNSRFIKKNGQELGILGNGQYQILSLLGKGGFSEVYKAFDLENLREVAIKIHQIDPNWPKDNQEFYHSHACRESLVQKKLDHDNIVKLYDIIEINDFTFATAMELCQGPDLSTYIKQYKFFSEMDAKQIIKQILNGLYHMNSQSQKVIHYDLKPQNIIFHHGQIKITDFGLCKIQEDSQLTKIELTSQGAGTYWYLPPECFKTNKPQISTKVDVWSLGVIFFEMVYGERPFGSNMSQDQILYENLILNNTKKLIFPKKPIVSEQCQNFIKQCLEYDQEDRMSVIEAFNHPYIQQNNNQNQSLVQKQLCSNTKQFKQRVSNK